MLLALLSYSETASELISHVLSQLLASNESCSVTLLVSGGKDVGENPRQKGHEMLKQIFASSDELYLPDALRAAMARSRPASAYPERLLWQHLHASGFALAPLPCRSALVSDGGGARLEQGGVLGILSTGKSARNASTDARPGLVVSADPRTIWCLWRRAGMPVSA